MSVSNKLLALRAGVLHGAVRADHPDVLLVTAGGGSRVSTGRASTLASYLTGDKWTVHVHSEWRHAAGRSDLGGVIDRLAFFRELVRVIPRHDIVHLMADSPGSFWCFVVPSLALARFFNKRIILSFLCPEVEDVLGRWGWLARPFFRLADPVVADCNYVAGIFARHGLATRMILPLPRRFAGSIRQITRLQPKILVDRPLTRANNVACLVRAFKFVKQKYPRSELLIAGDGPERQALQHLISAEYIHGVTFTTKGWDALFAEADLYANSSSYDTFPESILTALGGGLPVVTTDAGGIPQVVKDRINGMVVPINDHVGLAERIIELVENPELVAALTTAAGDLLRNFSWESAGNSWRRLYLATFERS
ncbi:MAG TPA: glycosyltransferase family 4 protein [Acidobacteriota bacterium]|nr:glycosyltransferase family 4 protein [Acidobacteriota bacterium]